MADDSMGAELHDRVISGLTTLLLEMEQFRREQYNRSGVQSSVTAFQDSMRKTIEALREVVHELQGSPPQLDHGLVDGIAHGPMVELKARTGAATKIVVSRRWPKDLSWATTMQLYRVVEQAMQNVTDHSGARNVTVSLDATDDHLIVEVVDDGLGLPLGTSVEGQGMRSMRQRAFVMGGTVDIRNRRKGGVVVRCRVQRPDPLNPSDD
jgi:two-component system, NarL family, sensor histidine kinase UhpB